MVYEWDEKRARRAHLTRVGIGLFVILMTMAVPAWVAVTLEIL
jgi:hypothetical protein